MALQFSLLLFLALIYTSTATGDLCKDNEHVSSGSCVPCPVGTTREGGDDPSLQEDTVCSTCAEDHSVERTADGSGWECVRCCDGYTRSAGDDFAVLNHTTTCDRCAAFHHAAEDTDGAAVFSSNLRCAPCHEGTWRQAGDNVAALEAPTECFKEIGIYPSIALGALFLVLFAACALLGGRRTRIDDDDDDDDDAEGPSGPRSGTTGPTSLSSSEKRAAHDDRRRSNRKRGMKKSHTFHRRAASMMRLESSIAAELQRQYGDDKAAAASQSFYVGRKRKGKSTVPHRRHKSHNKHRPHRTHKKRSKRKEKGGKKKRKPLSAIHEVAGAKKRAHSLRSVGPRKPSTVKKAGASSAAEIIARAERAEREQERMMHTFIDAANVAEPAGGSRRRSRQEMLARRSGSTRSATRKPSQLTAMLEAAQRRDAETQRLAAEAHQRLVRAARDAAMKTLCRRFLLGAVGTAAVCLLLLYLFQQAFMPDRESAGAAARPETPRQAGWCESASAWPSTSPTASRRPSASPTASPSAEGDGTNTTSSVGTGTASAGSVALIGGLEGAEAAAEATINALAPAVPEIPVQPGGSGLASGLGSMQSMNMVTKVCDSAVIARALMQKAREKGAKVVVVRKGLKEEERAEKAHMKLDKARAGMDWTNFRGGGGTTIPYLWSKDDRELREYAREDVRGWVSAEEKKIAEQERTRKQKEEGKGGRRLRATGDDRTTQPHGTTSSSSSSSSSFSQQDPRVEVHRILRRHLAAFSSVDGVDGDDVDGPGGGAEGAGEPDVSSSTNPTKFLLDKLTEEHKAFETMVTWLTFVAVLTFAIHLPTVAWAQHKVRERKREHRRKHHKDRARRRSRPGKTSKGKQFTIALFGLLAGTMPDSIDDHKLDAHLMHRGHHFTAGLLGYYAETFPRFEIMLAVLMFQTIAQTCTFTIIAPGSERYARMFAGLVFLCGPIAFLAWAVDVIGVKLNGQKRGALIRDAERTGGYLRWVDNPPMAAHKHYRRNNVQRHFQSGFVAKYGPLPVKIPHSTFFR